MTLTDQVVKNIIKRLIKGQDYRIEVVALINAEFLQFAIDFFKKVIEAKLANKDVSIDWYKKTFLNRNLSSEEIAINSGLNKKTITNMYNSASKEIVIDASNEHYDVLYESISNLIENQPDIDLTLTIKFRGVSVELNINESLNEISKKFHKSLACVDDRRGKRVTTIKSALQWKLLKFKNQMFKLRSKRQEKIPRYRYASDTYSAILLSRNKHKTIAQ